VYYEHQTFFYVGYVPIDRTLLRIMEFNKWGISAAMVRKLHERHCVQNSRMANLECLSSL
jgi:hypothetical protein